MNARILQIFKGRSTSSTVGKLAFCAALHHICMERNQRRFGDSNRTIDIIIHHIVADLTGKVKNQKITEDIILAQNIAECWILEIEKMQVHAKTCTWTAPTSKCVALNCDGSVSAIDLAMED